MGPELGSFSTISAANEGIHHSFDNYSCIDDGNPRITSRLSAFTRDLLHLLQRLDVRDRTDRHDPGRVDLGVRVVVVLFDVCYLAHARYQVRLRELVPLP
jgi:hypothetical protein